MNSFDVYSDQADGLRTLIKRYECREVVKAHQSQLRIAIVSGESRDVDDLMKSLELAQRAFEATYQK
ncbi:hypothetical protein BIT28_11145 [Photobacterium proteolyticum]|uniref:Uncharacterized protein n=1 Tax=Photobacterium proteolyticum TaxID=1903952 RepID=A0A1Q9G727_9GAMM|nr:hypothetical protein [Photobacterium proteolyticum]OLQ70081.1 hypothetical protein BIT28_11145 [Photobacterium proteolyticum]